MSIIYCSSSQIALFDCDGLKPVTDKYLDELAKSVPGARETYRKLLELLR